MNKEQLEKFNEKFDVYKAPNWWLPNLDDKKMYTLITEYNKSIKQFISDILKEERKDIIGEIKEMGKGDAYVYRHNREIYNQAIQDIIKTLTKQ